LNLDNNNVHFDNAVVEVEENLAIDLRAHDGVLKQRVQPLGIIIRSQTVSWGQMALLGWVMPNSYIVSLSLRSATLMAVFRSVGKPHNSERDDVGMAVTLKRCPADAKFLSLAVTTALAFRRAALSLER
jgi:hypothetical protein